MTPEPEVIRESYKGSGKLDQKVALITGGDSGIGRAVAPGPIWTPLIPITFDDEHVSDFGKSTPLGRPGQPSEVAPAYVFLASRDAFYISGQAIHVNGGEPVSSY